MPSYALTVSGRSISVEFPHDAYDCQLVFMQRVLEALAQVRAQLDAATEWLRSKAWGSRALGPLRRAATRCWRAQRARERRCVCCAPRSRGST
jgi:hypothetical protein